MIRSGLQDVFGAVNRKVGGSVALHQKAAENPSVSHRIIHHGREALENKGNLGIQAKPLIFKEEARCDGALRGVFHAAHSPFEFPLRLLAVPLVRCESGSAPLQFC